MQAFDLRAPAARPRALLLATVSMASALGLVEQQGNGVAAAVAERMPGPWPSRAQDVRLADPVTANSRCEACHQEIAQEWRASLHAQAYTNSAFQRALQIEPLPFCRGCHAPEANPLAAPDTALQELGVACVSCHVVERDVLGAPAVDVGPSSSPHPVLRSATFAGSSACGRCHEFAFPGQAGADPASLMQSTLSEHESSDFAGVACAACHMPSTESGRHRSHRFDVSRNRLLLQSALHVESKRVGPSRVELTLTANGVGHAFPTGDLFRRIKVQAEAVGPDHAVISSAETYLARSFITTRSPAGITRRTLTSDTRLGVGTASRQLVALELGVEATAYPIDYWITYERVAHPGEIGQPDARVEGSVELATGRLAPAL